MLNRTVPEAFDRDYKVYAVRGAVDDILRMFPFFRGGEGMAPWAT